MCQILAAVESPINWINLENLVVLTVVLIASFNRIKKQHWITAESPDSIFLTVLLFPPTEIDLKGKQVNLNLVNSVS